MRAYVIFSNSTVRFLDKLLAQGGIFFHTKGAVPSCVEKEYRRKGQECEGIRRKMVKSSE